MFCYSLFNRPNRANIEGVDLIGDALTAIGELLDPREAVAVLRRTPIKVIRKTPN